MPAQNHPFHRPEKPGPDAFRPGHLFWMKAGSTWLNHDKPRPFALVSSSTRGALATLVYGSTQVTEKIHGAAAVEVSPVPHGLNRNGLRTRTYFYPGALIPVLHERLPPRSGFLGKSLPDLRAALRVALGIGGGSCADPHAPISSCRGRVVAVSTPFARTIGATFAVVLTESAYSAVRDYQIILPIFAEFPRRAERYDLIVSAGDWLHAFPTAVNRVLLAIPLAQAVWHGSHIARETEYVLDDETLAEIDRLLCDYFSLPPAETEG